MIKGLVSVHYFLEARNRANMWEILSPSMLMYVVNGSKDIIHNLNSAGQ